jgi:PAS domain S-box-containing protein
MGASAQLEKKQTYGPEGSLHRRFFEGLPDMLFIATGNWRLMAVNGAGVRMFGYARKDDMYGIDSMALLFRDSEQWQLFREMIETQAFVQDVIMQMRRRDGSLFPARISANLRMEPDGKIVCQGLLRDMTEKRELQRALKEPDDPIREIRERVLHAFMILSHDLRGPLTSLSAGLDLLARGRYGYIDDNAVNKLKGLLRQTVRLSGVVEDHLARATVMDGFGEIQKEFLDLRKDIIDPILEELADEIKSRGITIEDRRETVPAGAVTIHAAGRWLRSLYRNLITNAVHHGGKGCVVFFGCEDHGRHYRLNVYNSGEPVPEELRDKLFTKFGRVRNVAKSTTAGMGLGLYLVREIIRKHGGDIWYEPGQSGSNFVFTIPKENERQT